MKILTLIETNPYLKDKEHREASNARSARSSCGVEGIRVGSFLKDPISIDSSKTREVLYKMKA
jgi:hypothetical protein